ncbi:MAG: zinc dependent phospholipase C family protein [Bacteroidia bacterium]
MKPIMLRLSIVVLVIVTFRFESKAWGFFAHQLINEKAVFCLPVELFPFYKKHILYIKEHAVDPDKRRYIVAEEAGRHFIDLDYYEKVSPIDTMPWTFKAACEKYTIDTINEYGIVPWHIQTMMNRLSEAFKNKNEALILKYSSELGHYVADAHVPLHNTMNYNGQMTEQHGIHGFFETRLPELFSSQYDLMIDRAIYLEQPLNFIWKGIEQGFSSLDSVFRFDKHLRLTTPESKKMSFEQRGTQQVKVWSFEYAMAYHRLLNNLVERRMRASIYAVSCYWYTAWVNGGQPDLMNLNKDKMSTSQDSLLTIQQNGKMIGRSEE